MIHVSLKEGADFMIQFSVDDSIEVFQYLTENNCDSVFDHPALKYFKELNDEYDFKVSMYCFYEKDGFNLSMCTDKYREEFEENAGWLNFGFHALNEITKYFDCDAKTFREDLMKVVNSLKAIVSEAAITYDVRLGFGQGNRDCIKAMKECFDEFQVLYGVDDKRIVYYLNQEENERYLAQNEFYDETIGITIKHCERRLESSTDFEERVKLIEDEHIHPFFTHEICLKNAKVLDYIRKLCESGQRFVL